MDIDNNKGYVERFHGTIEWVLSALLGVSFASFLFIESVSLVNNETIKAISSSLHLFAIPFYISGLISCRDAKHSSDTEQSDKYLPIFLIVGLLSTFFGFIGMIICINITYGVVFGGALLLSTGVMKLQVKKRT
ncbi:hypothetical protein H8F10_18170 [Vibrio fluvialis]|uniref:hypothetical protein n=1 Tax=Vibrio fluvialis TaxID=676 RepID=UPI00192B8797|nr:hypothetical protein [Vibrio fluvialis]MBL4279818.1 hypothetical protein [Vibrio fluvialis]